jgi:hypothetical protein
MKMTDEKSTVKSPCRAWHSRRAPVGLSLLASTLAISALGQGYTIDWYKIAGGGGSSAGGAYQASGTIGQPDASDAMTGGHYSLTSGFWSLYAVQTPGAPLLTITYLGNQAIVSWNSSIVGWTLQTNVDLATSAWGNYAGTAASNRVTNAPPQGDVFFRLIQP